MTEKRSAKEQADRYVELREKIQNASEYVPICLALFKTYNRIVRESEDTKLKTYAGYTFSDGLLALTHAKEFKKRGKRDKTCVNFYVRKLNKTDENLRNEIFDDENSLLLQSVISKIRNYSESKISN